MKGKRIFSFVLSICLLFGISSQVFADEQAEVILRALINAGVITQDDIDTAAKEIRKEKGIREAAIPKGIRINIYRFLIQRYRLLCIT